MRPDKTVITPSSKQEESSLSSLRVFFTVFIRTFKRTEGISTTDIVGRLLLMTKSHHFETGFEETKKLRKMSGEEGIAVNNLKEEALIEAVKTEKTGTFRRIENSKKR